MLEGLQFDPPHNVFHGVRFLLAGFDPINKSQVYSKLVDCGGVNVDQYGLHCTHVIVDKLTYDDPLCVAARKDGKILVNGLWVAHSFDVGVPVDPTSIMYRPPRDLNGIPGAKSLVVCLTGYQRQDRDDIMRMVNLMGANFSKPLVANKVTHLICYKFEGDKYELAKRTNRIKLVNHLWLEDCLKAWKLVPEADYNKSGYELEVLEAEAKDSEEETDISSKKNQLLIPKQEFKMNPLDPTPLKGLSTAIYADDNASANREDRKVHHDPHVSESHLKESEVLDFCGAEALRHVSSDKPVGSCDRVAFPPTVGNDFASTSGKERCLYSDTSKSSSKRHDSEFSKGTMPSICPREMEGNMRMPELVNSVDLDASAGVDIMTADPKNRTDIGCFRNPMKHVVPREEQCHKVNENMTCKAQRSDRCSTPLVSASSLEMDRSETFKPASSPGCPTEMRRVAACRTPALETSNTELSKDAELDEAFQISPMVSDETRKNNPDVIRRQESFTSEPLKISPLRRSDTKKSNAPLNLSLHADAQVEPPVKKFGRKSWTKGGASNVKGSIYMSNSAPHSANSINVGEKTSSNVLVKMVPAEINHADLEEAERKGLQPENKLQQTRMSVDDETEAPEDNVGYDPREVVIVEKNGEVKADIKQNNDILEHPQRQKSSSYTEPLGEQNNGFKGKETTCGNQKLGGSAASHNETCQQENDGARQLEATSGKRKLDESSPMQIAAKAYTRSSGDRLSSKTKKTEASEAHRGNEFLNAVGEGNCREVELGLIENYEEDKYKEAHTELKSITSGKRKVVESSKLENIVNDNKKVVKKGSLSKTNKRKVPTLSKTTDMKEVSIEEADKETSVDDIPHATEDQKNNESNNELDKSTEGEKENRPVRTVEQNVSHDKNVQNLTLKAVNNFGTRVCKSNFITSELQRTLEQEPVRFILSGHKLQRKEFQKVIRQLKGKLCRDTHQWSYQATHFIVPDPIRRTEKFFAAAASGRWILKTDYLSDSSRAGNFLAEEPYEWHKSGLSEDGAINLEAPRKWRLQKERTGHGAFYGMNVIIYGECFVPPLDTLKRAIKAGEGTILATSPPYTRFLGSGVDFAVVSPGMPRVDIWVQEFLRHEIPCVAVDYLVEFVCKPGYNLERHVLYNTHAWAEKSLKNVISRCEETAEPETPLRDGGESAVPCEEAATPTGGIEHDLPCQVCGSRDRGEEMLICGNENGTIGCGIGTHIDCCDPPLPDVPMEDWFCPKCRKKKSSKKPKIAAKKTIAAKRSVR